MVATIAAVIARFTGSQLQRCGRSPYRHGQVAVSYAN